MAYSYFDSYLSSLIRTSFSSFYSSYVSYYYYYYFQGDSGPVGEMGEPGPDGPAVSLQYWLHTQWNETIEEPGKSEHQPFLKIANS